MRNIGNKVSNWLEIREQTSPRKHRNKQWSTIPPEALTLTEEYIKDEISLHLQDQLAIIDVAKAQGGGNHEQLKQKYFLFNTRNAQHQ